MAWQAVQQGDYARAHTCFEQRLTVSQAAGVAFGGPWSSANLGHVYLREGAADYAEDTFATVQQGFHESGSKIGAEISAAATTEGQAMTLDQAVACAREQRTA